MKQQILQAELILRKLQLAEAQKALDDFMREQIKPYQPQSRS